MTESVDVQILARRLDAAGPDALPAYAHPGDAGADLRSTDEVLIQPGERVTVGTGVAIALPDGFAGFVVPRSGLAMKHGITIVNAPGTIDAGYRGELRVTLLNTDAREAYRVHAGDRIAQLILVPVARARFVPVDELPDSVRGTGGFGSTGYADIAAGAAPAAVIPTGESA